MWTALAIGIAVVLITGDLTLAACALSSRISQDLERKTPEGAHAARLLHEALQEQQR